MFTDENDRDVAAALRAGYAAPPPREAFAADLLHRLRRELRDSPGQPAAAPRPAAARPAAQYPAAARRWQWAAAAAAVLLVAGGMALVALHHGGGPPAVVPGEGGMGGVEPSGTPEDQMVPLELKLPRAVGGPTPKHIKPSPYLEPPTDKPRPPIFVPQGTTNVALGKPVTSSDPVPVVGELKQLTDGDKDATDGSYIELGPGTQWVQVDLKQPCEVYAVVVWHYHGDARVYHDVVVQVADDPDFIENVRTVYNNDYDNSSGLGVGKDLEYIDDYRGRLIDCKGVKGRYVRLYSKGNTSNDFNNYIEIEVYGKPLAAAPAASQN